MRLGSVGLVLLAVTLARGPVKAAESWQDKLPACLACHGEGGISPTPEVPSLAAQPDLFTQWQLVYFRDGTRASDTMVPVAKDLTDAEIRALGGYFAALPPPQPGPGADPAPDLSAAGAKLAAEGRCGNCHLPNFAGQSEMPRLAAQQENALVKALEDYKSGARRGRGNAAMPEITFGLSADDMKALAHFLSRQ